MRARLSNTPKTQAEWDQWAFDHMISHRAIIKAIAAANGPTLTEYVLNPITQIDFQRFLEANQQMHIDATGLLGIQSIDLSEVNFQNPSERQAWIFNHAQNHYDMETKLGIAS